MYVFVMLVPIVSLLLQVILAPRSLQFRMATYCLLHSAHHDAVLTRGRQNDSGKRSLEHVWPDLYIEPAIKMMKTDEN